MEIKFSDLEDKVVVIAGATGLIGKEVVKGFAKQASNVVITSRDTKRAKNLQKEMANFGPKSIVYNLLDISKEESINKLIENVLDAYNKIDVFVNCSWPRTQESIQDVGEIPFEVVERDLTNHLGGYFLCAQKIANQMKKQDQGNIINFSSIYGMVGPHFEIYKDTKITCPPAYPLVKGGIIQMTKYFAIAYAKDNIRVNCISPGGIFNNHDKKFVKQYSKHVPLGRMADAKEIVGATLFLASNASSYITGTNIPVDGGWTVW